MSLLDFNTFKPNYIGKPVEAIGNYFQEAGKQRDRIVDSTSALDIALSNLDISEGDIGAKQLKDEQYNAFKTGVQQVIDTDSSTVGNAMIKKLSRDFITNKGLQQAVENKQLLDQERASLKSRFEKGDISKAGYNFAIRQPAHQTIKGDDGFYSKYTPDNVVDLFDFDTALSAYGSKFRETVERNTSNYRRNPDGTIAVDAVGNPIGTTQLEERYKNADMLAEGLRETIISDPIAYASAIQEAGYQGIDVDSYINNKIDPILKRESGRTTADLGQLYKGSRSTKAATTAHITELQVNAIMGDVSLSGDIPVPANMEDAVGKLSKESRFWGDMGYNLKAMWNVSSDTREVGTPRRNVKALDETQLKISNNIAKSLGSTKSVNDMTNEELNTFAPRIIEYMNTTFKDHLSNSAGLNMEDNTSEGVKLRLFGTDKEFIEKDKDNKKYIMGGTFPESMVYSTELEEPVTGRKLLTMIEDGNIKDLKNFDKLAIRPTRVHNFKNPISTVTGDPSFNDAISVSIGGKEFYVANPGKYAGKPQEKYLLNSKAAIYHTQDNPNVPNTINFVIVKDNRNINEDVDIEYNNRNGIYTATFNDGTNMQSRDEGDLTIQISNKYR